MLNNVQGAKTLVSLANRLPLAFQVCSVRLSETESQPCWSRERARQSTALPVCSAPVPRATEDIRKTTVTTDHYCLLLTATVLAARHISHLPPASRCVSAPLFASVSRSCWFRAPSRPWPVQTGWNGPGHTRWLVTAYLQLQFSAFKVHSTCLLQIP